MSINKVIMRPNKTLSLVRSYKKTISVIKSCKTKDHLEGASRMVENFKNLYLKVGYPKLLSYKLSNELKNKMGSLNKTH